MDCELCHINPPLPAETANQEVLRLKADLYNIAGVLEATIAADKKAADLSAAYLASAGQVAESAVKQAEVGRATAETLRDQKMTLELQKQVLVSDILKTAVRTKTLETEITKLGGTIPPSETVTPPPSGTLLRPLDRTPQL